MYENALRTLVQAGKVLEGELYPTASSVIPFLDTVFADLATMSSNLRGTAKIFVDLFLSNLKSSKRFPNGYKSTAPYNVLTLLDPRFDRKFEFELLKVYFCFLNQGTLICTSVRQNMNKLLSILITARFLMMSWLTEMPPLKVVMAWMDKPEACRFKQARLNLPFLSLRTVLQGEGNSSRARRGFVSILILLQGDVDSS